MKVSEKFPNEFPRAACVHDPAGVLAECPQCPERAGVNVGPYSNMQWNYKAAYRPNVKRVPGAVHTDAYGTPYKIVKIIDETCAEVRLLTWYERLWRWLTCTVRYT